VSRATRIIAGIAILLCLGIVGAWLARHWFDAPQPATPAPAVLPDPAAIRFPRNVEEFDQLFEAASNWGRWGPNDQLGAMNLITDEKRKAAVATVKLGRAVSLSRPLATASSTDMANGMFSNGSPFEHTMNPDLFSDTYTVNYHSYLHSHLDALCHFAWKGMSYNGQLTADVNTANGCTKLGVENLRDGVVARGVLIDIPRLRNLQWLEPGTAVFAEDIEAWEKMAGVRISEGDVLFLRTGRWARWERLGPWNVSMHEAGLHPSAASWLKERGVAVIGSDSGLDVMPSPVEGIPDSPMHILALTALGVAILDNQDLEALADTAAELKRWEFMVSFAPLVVSGGTGSPVNAVAVF